MDALLKLSPIIVLFNPHSTGYTCVKLVPNNSAHMVQSQLSEVGSILVIVNIRNCEIYYGRHEDCHFSASISL